MCDFHAGAQRAAHRLKQGACAQAPSRQPETRTCVKATKQVVRVGVRAASMGPHVKERLAARTRNRRQWTHAVTFTLQSACGASSGIRFDLATAQERPRPGRTLSDSRARLRLSFNRCAGRPSHTLPAAGAHRVVSARRVKAAPVLG